MAHFVVKDFLHRFSQFLVEWRNKIPINYYILPFWDTFVAPNLRQRRKQSATAHNMIDQLIAGRTKDDVFVFATKGSKHLSISPTNNEQMENTRAIFNLPLQIRPPADIDCDSQSCEFSQPSRQFDPHAVIGREGDREQKTCSEFFLCCSFACLSEVRFLCHLETESFTIPHSATFLRYYLSQ